MAELTSAERRPNLWSAEFKRIMDGVNLKRDVPMEDIVEAPDPADAPTRAWYNHSGFIRPDNAYWERYDAQVIRDGGYWGVCLGSRGDVRFTIAWPFDWDDLSQPDPDQDRLVIPPKNTDTTRVDLEYYFSIHLPEMLEVPSGPMASTSNAPLLSTTASTTPSTQNQSASADVPDDDETLSVPAGHSAPAQPSRGWRFIQRGLDLFSSLRSSSAPPPPQRPSRPPRPGDPGYPGFYNPRVGRIQLPPSPTKYSKFLWQCTILGCLCFEKEGDDRGRKTDYIVVKNLAPPSHAGIWLVADAYLSMPEGDEILQNYRIPEGEDCLRNYESHRATRVSKLPGLEEEFSLARIKEDGPEGEFHLDCVQRVPFVISSTVWISE